MCLKQPIDEQKQKLWKDWTLKYCVLQFFSQNPNLKDTKYLNFAMFVPSINQSSDIPNNPVSQIWWLTVHVSTNYDRVSWLRQKLNKLWKLVWL